MTNIANRNYFLYLLNCFSTLFRYWTVSFICVLLGVFLYFVCFTGCFVPCVFAGLLLYFVCWTVDFLCVFTEMFCLLPVFTGLFLYCVY